MAYSYKCSISFGLVYIPVTLHNAVKSNDIDFNMIDKKTMSRVKYKKTCADCGGREVKQEDIVKGYEYEDGKYVTHSKIFGSGEQIAEQIRNRVKKELGLTVSVGVSWNKIFAKLGSDMKKPDAVTVITPENYKELVWTLPVEDLLYVGKATKTKLNKVNIKTIGEHATADEKLLVHQLGRWGKYLFSFAKGEHTIHPYSFFR